MAAQIKGTETVLLAEDSDDDVFFMRRAWKSAEVTNPLQVVRDGQQAIDYIAGTGPYADRVRFPIPPVIILDLKLPLKSGHEVLQWIRSNPACKNSIVIFMTSSKEHSDVKKAYDYGLNAYLVKPSPGHELVEMLRAFKTFWLRFNVLAV